MLEICLTIIGGIVLTLLFGRGEIFTKLSIILSIVLLFGASEHSLFIGFFDFTDQVRLLWGLMLALTFGVLFLVREGKDAFYILLLCCVLGGLLLVASNHFLSFFLALELLSLPLYCLCASSNDKPSAEAGIKYFMMGSFGSATLLFGIALFYGVTGSFEMSAVGAGDLSIISVGLIMMGLLFKVGAVPFHFWLPDVYQGSPLSVTAFMATVVKVAAVGGLIAVFGKSSFLENLSRLIGIVSVLSIFIGTFGAMRQLSIKRLLAFSAILNIGIMLLSFLSGDMESLIFYLVIYSFTSLGIFSLITTDKIEDLSRLSKFNKILLTLFMLSLAGLPPLVASLFSKAKIFIGAIKAGYPGIAIFGLLAAAIAVYYYLKVIRIAWNQSGSEEKSKVVGFVVFILLVLFSGAPGVLGSLIFR